jgi:hypothetical protein
MQASLPSMVRMVAVDDIGQGSEALRILGVRWLPTGAAARSVSAEGKLKSPGEEKDDRKVQDDGEGQEQLRRQDTMEPSMRISTLPFTYQERPKFVS